MQTTARKIFGSLNPADRLRLLGLLANDPSLSQRQLARELGISVGKVNYCLKALLDRGYVKAVNFKNSQHKRAYLYQLTSAGVTAKARAVVFLNIECPQTHLPCTTLSAHFCRWAVAGHDPVLYWVHAGDRTRPG